MKQYKYTINGNKYEVTIGDINDNIVSVEVNGETFTVETEKTEEPVKAPVQPVVQSVAVKKAPTSNKTIVKAPLPGVIREVKVAVGEKVSDSQTVVILEAMKMANNIDTEAAGTVVEICVQPGQSVMEDDALVDIE